MVSLLNPPWAFQNALLSESLVWAFWTNTAHCFIIPQDPSDFPLGMNESEL